MKKHIATLLLCLAAAGTSLNAQNDSTALTHAKDSLLSLLKTLPDDSQRMKTYYSLAMLYRGNTRLYLHYIDLTLREAERWDDDKYRCLAYVGYLKEAYNALDMEAVNEWAGKLEPLARRKKYYDFLFISKRCSVDMLLLREQYELQEKEAKEMLRQALELDNKLGIVYAYQCLANGYTDTYRYPLAIETLEKAYEKAVEYENLTSATEIASAVITISTELRDTARWIKYTRLQEQDQQKLIARHQKAGTMNNDLMLTQLAYLDYYTYTGKWEQAAQALRKAERYYSPDFSSLYQKAYRESRYFYFLERKDTARALEEIDAALSTLKMNANYYYADLPKKAIILWRTGREKEALALFKESLVAKDSLNHLILSKQTYQIRDNYQRERQNLERQQIQARIRISVLILLGLLLAGFVYLGFHFRRVGRTLRKAEAEMGRMAGDVEQANLAKERFLSNISTSIRGPLDVIVSHSDTLSGDAQLPPEEKKLLSQIVSHTSEELMSLINDILLLSKLEAGMLRLTISPIEAIPCLRGLAEAPRQRGGTPVDAHLPDNVSWIVRVDIGYFSQLIESLISAPADSSAPITLSARQTSGGDLCIEIYGSALSLPSPTQESTIHNEINRMLAAQFSGRYDIFPGRTCIIIELPLEKDL